MSRGGSRRVSAAASRSAGEEDPEHEGQQHQHEQRRRSSDMSWENPSAMVWRRRTSCLCSDRDPLEKHRTGRLLRRLDDARHHRAPARRGPASCRNSRPRAARSSARGAFSRPSTMSSRYLMRPSRSQRRHVAQEIAVARGEVRDDEAADGQPLGQDRADQRGSRGSARPASRSRCSARSGRRPARGRSCSAAETPPRTPRRRRSRNRRRCPSGRPP